MGLEKLHFSRLEQRVIDTISICADELKVPCYLIGGYVRDKVMNRPSSDIDVVAIGDALLLARSVAQKLQVKPPVIYKRFGTAKISFEKLEIEFVGARKESYSSDSRKPDISSGTLQDDQNRRDFTINALAIGLGAEERSEFLDPFGGLSDIDQMTIRTPLDPDKTFSDDPLRMMRAIRFATQLDFRIDPVTFEGIKRNKDRIKIVSKERIITELNKIISAELPSRGFELLLESGLIKIIFPEMYELYGVDYVGSRGHKDNYYHTIQVLDNVAKKSDDLWLRWAAIMHDIGKPKTKRYDQKSGWTFHGHDAVGAGMVAHIFKRLKLPLDHNMKFVKKLVRLHLRPISLTNEEITDSAVRRLLFDAGEDIDALMLLCEADITTKNKNKMQRYLSNYEKVKQRMMEIEEKDHFRNWQPPISGEVIMETFGIPPSRLVGDIKKAIREAILDGNIPNNYDAAHQYMMEIAADLGVIRSAD